MQLFIPSKIKIGFQKREDTYTKKLAYVIYYDLKNKLRKETSWNSWRDHEIEPLEFENKPISGFVLNKGVGGARQSYGWNTRNEYIRVYDPRDFEFEISVSNLLFILRECNCNKGKGLEGNFVYGWDGTELVLLPETAEDYQKSVEYTGLQDKGVKIRDLVFGASYLTKKQESLTYLGKFDCYSHYDYQNKVQKKYVFHDGKSFIFYNDTKKLATRIGESINQNYPYLVEEYIKSEHGSGVSKLFLKKLPKDDKNDYWNYWYFEENGSYYECNTYNNNELRVHRRVFLDENNTIKSEYLDAYAHKKDENRQFHHRKVMKWREPTNEKLCIELESGSKFKFLGYSLVKIEE